MNSTFFYQLVIFIKQASVFLFNCSIWHELLKPLVLFCNVTTITESLLTGVVVGIHDGGVGEDSGLLVNRSSGEAVSLNLYTCVLRFEFASG